MLVFLLMVRLVRYTHFINSFIFVAINVLSVVKKIVENIITKKSHFV